MLANNPELLTHLRLLHRRVLNTRFERANYMIIIRWAIQSQAEVLLCVKKLLESDSTSRLLHNNDGLKIFTLPTVGNLFKITQIPGALRDVGLHLFVICELYQLVTGIDGDTQGSEGSVLVSDRSECRNGHTEVLKQNRSSGYVLPLLSRLLNMVNGQVHIGRRRRLTILAAQSARKVSVGVRQVC
jgi:hypothetical protein